MKKIIVTLSLVLAAAATSGAAVLDSAFAKIKEIPNLMTVVVPEEHCIEHKFETGEVALAENATPEQKNAVERIASSIPDDNIITNVNDGEDIVTVYGEQLADGKTGMLIVVISGKSGNPCVVTVYCTGGADLLDRVNVDGGSISLK